MYTKPAESYAPGDERQHDQNVGPKCSEIGVRAQDEEDDNLDSERDAVAEKNDAVDGAVRASEAKDLVVLPTNDDSPPVD